MADRLVCPQCGGSGEQNFGVLAVQCEFCCGRGYVGEDNEPGEERETAGPPAPVWEQPGVSELAVCPMCLGRGEVVHAGTERPARSLTVSPCPACRPAE
jgi:DnaJ-class molecular chaperone